MPTPPPPSGCAVWLRADLGITKNGSNRVTQWNDQSPNGYIAANAVSDAHRPLWVPAGTGGGTSGLAIPALDWGATLVGDSSTYKYLDSTNAETGGHPIAAGAPRTVVATIKPAHSDTGGTAAVGGIVYTNKKGFIEYMAEVYTYASGVQEFGSDRGYTYAANTPTDYTGQWIVVSWEWGGTGSTDLVVKINGVVVPGNFNNAGNLMRAESASDGFTIGYDQGNSYTGHVFSGMIAEIIVYPGVDALVTAGATTTLMSRAGLTPPPFTGLRDTSAYVVDASQPYRPFYYLKISGLPYYFGSIIDPTDSKWGSYQWTLGAGYSWIKGMDIPAGSLEQSITDMIGGVATSERITLSMMDFQVSDTSGAPPHSFFGYLLSPGRMTTNTSAVLGTLHSGLSSAAVTAGLAVRAGGGAFAGASSPEVDTYIGGETVGVSAVTGPTGDQIFTLTVNTRNKYPCTANYPPRSNVIVPLDVDGNVDDGSSMRATQGAPLTFLYRTAALYIGHLTPDGNPDIEANATCRMIGRIKSVNYGRDPGKFEFELESIMTDLTTALVAPGLARASVVPEIHLEAEQFRELLVVVQATHNTSHTTATAGVVYTVDNGLGNVYADPRSLAAAINTAIAASTPQLQLSFGGGITDYVTISVAVVPDSDGPKFLLKASPGGTSPVGTDTDFTFTVTYSDLGINSGQTGVRASLLRPMGFIGNSVWAGSAGSTDGVSRVTSPQVAPSLFIPTEITGAGTTFDIIPASTLANQWFTDQGDGSGEAFIRFGGGVVAKLLAVGPTTLTLGATGQTRAIPGGAVYVPFAGTTPLFVEQIVRLPSSSTISVDHSIGQLLASTGYANDGEYNVLPPGVGLGLDGILDKESLRAAAALFPQSYQFDVDGSTKFMDLWAPMAKEQGLFLVWDPATATITLRSLVIPNYAASSTFQFTESNRPTTQDRSMAAQDISNIRTGWTLRYGWDPQTQKFLGPQINIVNNRAIADYQVSSRVETIEDKIIPLAAGDFVADILGSLAQRFDKLSYPWTKVTRGVNKTGLLLSPGTYHKIIDKTIFNHFTGIVGISSTDNVYGWLMSVKSTLADGLVTVTFLIDQQTDGTTLRPWSPTGKLNFVASGNGYDNTTGILTMDSFYCSDPSGLLYDGISFQVGDKVYLTTLDNPTGTPAYSRATTITAISADGSNVTVGAGLGAVSTTVETIMILQNWGAPQTADRKAGDHRTSFQGDGNALLIAAVARLHKWS